MRKNPNLLKGMKVVSPPKSAALRKLLREDTGIAHAGCRHTFKKK